MQVQVSIVLENALEFERWTTQQALIADMVRRNQSTPEAAAPVIETTAAPVAEVVETPVTEVVEETTVVKKKRRRRTNAQIAADDTERAEAAKAEVARAEAADEKARIDAIDDSPDVSGPAVESITPKPDVVDDGNEGKTYTLEDAMPIMRAFIAQNNSAPLIAKLSALGVERVNEIAPKKLSGFLAELVAETAVS